MFSLSEEERAMRRVSYLKATWGDRLHLDSDVEPEAEQNALRRYLLATRLLYHHLYLL